MKRLSILGKTSRRFALNTLMFLNYLSNAYNYTIPCIYILKGLNHLGTSS